MFWGLTTHQPDRTPAGPDLDSGIYRPGASTYSLSRFMVTPPIGSLTSPHRLLIAALSLEDGDGFKTWTESQLAVTAWQKTPKVFGLDGFRDKYPDNNTVRVCLSGKLGLITKGYLDRVAPKTYRLTKAGRDLAKSLVNGDTPQRIHATTYQPAAKLLTPRLQGVASRLLDSKAFRYWTSQQSVRICFDLAMEFWGIGLDSKPTDIDKAIRKCDDNIADLLDCVQRQEHRLSSGQILRLTDMESMVECQKWLRETFSRRIEKMAS